MTRRVATSAVLSGTPAKTKKVVLPVTDPKSIADRFKDFPAIDVLQRRFTNPNDPGSLPILLKDEHVDACTNSEHMNRLKANATTCHCRLPNGKVCGRPVRRWFVRWFNFAEQGRAAQFRQKGYVPVAVDELQDMDDVADLFEGTDTRVRRGDRGQEVLGKIPLEAFNYVKSKQRESWNAAAQSRAKTKAALAEAAGKELGDEAGQMIHDDEIRVDVMKRSRTTLGAEADLDQDEGDEA